MIKATIAVTAVLIWMQVVTALGPTINAMSTFEDNASMINAIEQQIELADNTEPDNDLGDILSSIFSIPGASADFDDWEENYTALEKKVDGILDGFYDRLEKSTDKNGVIDKLEGLSEAVEKIKTRSSIKNNASQLALVNFIGDHVQDKLDQLNGNSNDNSNTVKDTIKQTSNSNGTTATNDTDKDDDIKSAPAATSDIGNSQEFKDFVDNGWKAIDLSTADGSKFHGSYGYFWDSEENFRSAQKSFKAAFPTQDWSKVSLEDSVIPGEVIFNMPREQIQELTQDLQGRATLMNKYGMTGTYKMNDNIEMRYTNNGSIGGGSAVYNEMKYHFLINWEIEIGSDKYNDFRTDYFADDRVEVKDSGLYVALEPLPLGKTLEQKIENGSTLTSDELIQAWNTALELENLSDRYEIKKALIWSTIGYKVVDNDTWRSVTSWTIEDGSKLGSGLGYTSVTSGTVWSYLFSRYR